MKIRFTLFVFGVLAFVQSNAQEVNYSLYNQNNAAYNAGFTGYEDFMDTRIGFRQNWNGFGINNNSFFVSAYTSLDNTKRAVLKSNSLRTSNPAILDDLQSNKKLRRKHGLGGMISNRNLGPYKAITITGNYAYHLPITRKLNLSFGTRFGLHNERLRFDGLTVRDDVNDVFYQQLMKTSQGTQNMFRADFGYVLYSDDFYLGISSENLVKSKLGVTLLETSAQTHYSLQAAAIAVRLNENWSLSPAVKLIYAQSQALQWAFNARIRYKEVLYFGSGYSNDGSKVSMLFGLTPTEVFTIHYAYDRYFSDLNNFNVKVHEVVLAGRFFNKHSLRPKLW